MVKDEEKTPDKSPTKEVIKTPPHMPVLPPRNPSPKNLNGGAVPGPAASDQKPPAFDFRAAIKNAVAADGGGGNGASAEFVPKPKHVRGVSWDQNVTNNERVSPQPPRPATDGSVPVVPTLMPKTTTGNGPLPPRPPAMTRRGISGGSRRMLLEAIPDDPYEREAEDVLMRALEERDPMHAKANTGANILPGVPVDLIQHDFSVDSGAKPSTNDVVEPVPLNVQERPRMVAREQSVFNRARAGSTDHSVGSKNNRPTLAKPALVKRQVTVEEALFGLTAALSAVKHEDRKAGHLPREDRDRPPGHQRIDTASSTDALAKTAELVFGRRFSTRRSSVLTTSSTSSDDNGDKNENVLSSPQEASSTPASAPSPRASLVAKSRWGLVKDNLDQYKKNDDIADDNKDDELDGVDIEIGDDNPTLEASNRVDDPVNTSDNDDGNNEQEDKKSNKRRKKRKTSTFSPFKHLPYSDMIKKEWDLFSSFMAPRKATMFTYARYIILYLWVPALGIASILYHFFENPPTGRGPFTDPSSPSNSTNTNKDEPVPQMENQASVSWWLIFICMRQVGLVIIAKSFEAILVDFLAIQTRAILRSFGPVITLLFVQSKGWPFLLSSWGILNFVLVTGNTEFNRHWLYWQDVWGLFNDHNPAGDVTNTLWFKRICAVASALGFAVAAKRVVVGIYLGRQTFSNYSDKLAQIMNKMLQVSQVAILSQAIERRYWAEMDRFNDESAYYQQSQRGFSRENLLVLIENANDEGSLRASHIDFSSRTDSAAEYLGKVIDTDDVDPFTGGLGEAQKARIADLLGRWEEPGRGHIKSGHISVGAVLQFRRALASMDTAYPFSGSFGPAETRENCIISAQRVYERLLLKNQTINGKLHFDTIAVLALQGGDLDSDQAKELIRTFRPDRDGGISMVDFVRSIDAIYKELRMLRATVAASSKIDKALETIMNIVFYVLVTCIILAAYGFDPLALFLSLSSIILAFAFMIGSASAKYFEGLLFILVQRPYGIGDRINVANPESETNGAGAQAWIVDDVTLFTTSMYMVGTNERATVSNGVLAKSRIINGARSHKAILVLPLKFGIEVPYNRIEIFKSAVEKFVKARPREWLGLLAIRAGRVDAELGFVEYGVVLQHREAWQNAGPILDSKHAIHCFMLELTKKLDLRYKQPPLPILLNHGATGPIPSPNPNYNVEQSINLTESQMQLSPRSVATTSSDEVQAVISMFDGR